MDFLKGKEGSEAKLVKQFPWCRTSQCLYYTNAIINLQKEDKIKYFPNLLYIYIIIYYIMHIYIYTHTHIYILSLKAFQEHLHLRLTESCLENANIEQSSY